MLTNNPPDGITAGPVAEDDLLNWEALIQGPEGTPFEGGVFPAELKFPNDYPLSPPTMKFLGEIWHPNGMSRSARAVSHANTHREREREKQRTDLFALLLLTSLPERPGLHIHPPPRG